MMLPDSLWWEEIAGPSRFLSDIESALDAGKSALIETTSAFPYRESFIAELDHRLGNNAVACLQVDCAAMDAKDDPYLYLLEQTGQPRQVLSDYRRQKGQNAANFLRTSGIFSGKVVWLHHIPAAQVKLWLRLTSMHASSFENGVFLIETQFSSDGRADGRVPTFRYGDYVRADDLRLFVSTLAAHSAQMGSDTRQYLVELAAALCGADGELAEELIAEPELLLKDPIARLREIAEGFDPRRGAGMADHPFCALSKSDNTKLDRCVWTAQVRVGYPHIEMERLRLIQKWYAQIQLALKTPYRDSQDDGKHYIVDSDKKRVTDPYDLEVGMLVRMTALRRYTDDIGYLLYLPTEDYDLLHLLRDCRNKLAHLCSCPYEMFRALLGE